MRFLLLLLLITILGAGSYVYKERADYSTRIMNQALKSNLLDTPLADLGDGLHVTLCGAGGPLPDTKRSGPCVAVAAGNLLFIVDAGTNGVRNLGRLRYPVGNIEGVFLTHYHSDHIDGLGELATLRWVQGNRTTPLPVTGPVGVEDIVAGFNQAYARDAIYRNKHHGDAVAPLSGRGMSARALPTPVDGKSIVAWEADGVKVSMFKVDHSPVYPAVGYLFTYKNRSVLISGDTTKSENLQSYAHNVDLLVHEALSEELVGIINHAARVTGNKGLEKITIDIPDYHTTPRQAAEIARDAGALHLLYYHVVPPMPIPGLEAAFLDGVDEIFPHYTLGRDGTTISLPANSREVVVVSGGL
jgi:ribonuclease Z